VGQQDVSVRAIGELPPVVKGASASGRYLVDQFTNGIIPMFDSMWAMVQQAGNTALNGGSATYQQDMDYWITKRSAQGFNGLKFNALGNTESGAPNADGRTWDTKYPFGSTAAGTAFGNPSSGLASDYWTRVDYLVDQAAAAGMTCFIFVFETSDLGTTNVMSNGSGTIKALSEFQAYGTALGNRYKNKTNIVWAVGADYFDEQVTKVEGTIDALRATGDAHLFTVENHVDLAGHHWTTSRKDDLGATQQLGTDRATLNGSYIYDPTHLSADAAWVETPTIPNIWFDGNYEGGSDAHALRSKTAWSLTYGQWGAQYGSDTINGMPSGWRTTMASATTAIQHMAIVRSKVAGYTRWPDLVPDRSSSFVTAGRGSGTSFVTASKTADGKLAIIYMPAAGTAITVATAQMVSGYTVTWVDPTDGHTVSGSQGTSFSRATANSAGDADWLLVLKEP
jgi:hypothetical protein